MKKILNEKNKSPHLVGILLIFSAFFIYHRFIFGDELWVFVDPDIGSDTIQQYLQHYHTVINHIRDGSFTFWDFNNGFGSNMFNLNLFDPTLMLIYALGVLFGPEHIAWYLVYMQVIRIVLAGVIFYHYLSCFTFTEKSKCIVSYIYGLNGFLMVWGQHYQLGMAAVYLPLLLWGAERCMQKRRFYPPMVLAVWLSTIYSTYLSYMMFVCLGFYILVRLFGMQDGTLKEKFRFLGCLYGSMLLGIGMGALTMLPTAFNIFSMSGRMTHEYSFLERILYSLYPYERQHYKTLFYKFFSSYMDGLNHLLTPDSPYTGVANYYEDPNVFCSTLFLILGCQYLCCLPRFSLPKRQKLLRLGLLAVLAFCLLLPFSGLVMNGFAVTFNRHTFLMMPFFCLIMAEMLHTLLKKKTFSYGGFGVALLWIAFVLIRKYPTVVYASHRQNALILSITGILMAAILFCLTKCKKQQLQTYLYVCLLCLTVINMASEGYTSTLERLTLRKDDDEYFDNLYDQDIQDALAWLREQDDQFYRVEKDFDSGSVCLDSLAQGYRSASTYNSTMNQNIQRFAAALYQDFWYNDMAHYRFRMVEQGHTLADLCGIRYLLSRNDREDDPYDKSGYRLIKEFGNIQIYENEHETSLGRFYPDTVTLQEFKQYLEENGVMKTRDYILEHLVIEGASKKDLTHSAKKASAQAVTIQSPVKDNHLEGTVNASEDGYVMFAIPFEKGWEIYLDGEKQEIFEANLGFQGIAVKKGLHQIELKYQAPQFAQGLTISILCWLAFLLLVYYFHMLKSKSQRSA